MANVYGDRPDQFYIDLYPVLADKGWQDTGAIGYGMVRWQMKLRNPKPLIKARFCFVMSPNTARISLEVRHEYHGSVCVDLDGIAQADLRYAIQNTLPGLVANVEQRYEEWSNSLDHYGIPRATGARMMATFNSDVQVAQCTPFPGFRRDGWAVLSTQSSEYLVNLGVWTANESEANVFNSLSTAVATAEGVSYFSCSSDVLVIAVQV